MYIYWRIWKDQKPLLLWTYQPFKHWDVIIASFPTNLSAVRLFPCMFSIVNFISFVFLPAYYIL